GSSTHTVDTSANAGIDVDVITSDSIINSSESNADITITGFVSGNASPGDTVDIYLDGEVIGSGAVSNARNDSGQYTYSVVVDGADLANTDSATPFIMAKVSGTDGAGNTFEATSSEIYKVDTNISTPSISFESAGADDVYSESEVGDDGTVTATITLDGSKVGDILTYTVGDEVFTVELTLDHEIDGFVLIEVEPGQSITATLSDQAGNTSLEATATALPLDNLVDAKNDSVNVDEDNSIELHSNAFSLLSNDDGLDGGLKITAIAGVELTGQLQSIVVDNGTVEIDSSGVMTFVPTADYSGEVSFDYTVTDSNGSVDTATVTVTVNAVADEPSLSVTEMVTITADDVTAGSGKATGNGYTLMAYNHFVGINSNDNEEGVLTTITDTDHDGIGVDAETVNGSDPFSEIGSNAEQSEAIVVTFDDAVTSVQASFGWLSSSETASYTLYSSDGDIVGTGELVGGNNQVSDAGTITATDSVEFYAIAFTADYKSDVTDSDDNDFLLNSLTFENVVSGTDSLSTPEGGDVSFSISAATTDVDGSETLKVEVKDIPVGFTLTDGTNTFTAEEGLTVADVTGWNLSELTLETDYIEETTTYDLEVVATASEGNTESASTQTISIKVVNDESIATPSIVFESTGDDDVYNAEELGEDGTVTATISVTGSVVGDTLTYSVDDGSAVTVTLIADDITNGVAVEVAPGAKVTATLSDEAGNSSSEVSATAAIADLFVDPPVITNITDDSADSDYSTVTLHGTGEAGATITLWVIADSTTNGNDTQTGEYTELTSVTTTVSVDGTWTLDVSSLDGVPVNDNEFFKVVQTDDAGNTSDFSNTAHYFHGDIAEAQVEAGDDYVLTGSGDDVINLGVDDSNGQLTIDGGAGTDTVIFSDFDLDKASFVLNDDGSLQITRGDTNDIVLLIDVENVKIDGTTYTLDALYTPTVTISDDTNNDGLLNNAESDGAVSVKIALPLAAKLGDTITITSNNGEDDRVITLNPNHLANGYVIETGITEVGEGETLTVTATLSSGGNTGADSVVTDTLISLPTIDLA
ncbi:beta strand repeat-containing protein, partial [Marinomonas ushuaiensis]|uniref:beta strand repeat-containing protein n=1 Tax=Marinomonas ushuaiensis TaxID=263818 RepID=UPI00056792B6